MKLKLLKPEYNRVSACVDRVDLSAVEWCDYACKRYAKRTDLVVAWAVANDESMGSATTCATIGDEWLNLMPPELLRDDDVSRKKLANFARRAIMRAVELAEVANDTVPTWLGIETARVMELHEEGRMNISDNKKAMELFAANTITKREDGRVMIDCRLGLWGVSALTLVGAMDEARRYFVQYWADGEYDTEDAA